MTRVKICGINSPDGLDACVEAGVDWIGFNFYPRSPRYVTPAQAAVLSHHIQGGPCSVGLFVQPRDSDIAETLASLKLDILQIYADSARVAELGSRFQIEVWRAIGVTSRDDLPHEAGGADGFVVEAPARPGERPGGNARVFDWAMLHGWHAPKPWLLAGGLTTENVGLALNATQAPAVDVSSGVESAPGCKSPALIRAFVAAVRQR